jgi:hypothetical protein
MSDAARCPICLNKYGDCCRVVSTTPGSDRYGLDCDYCGQFEISGSALAKLERNEQDITPLQRSVLAHHTRISSGIGRSPPLVKSVVLEKLLENPVLPNPAEQSANLIRLIGDHLTTTGEPLFISNACFSLVGAFNPDRLSALRSALNEGHLIRITKKGTEVARNGPGLIYGEYCDLTLQGWDKYETERRGRFAGNFGFLAMRFGDATLDPFVRDVLKPCVKNELVFDLFDMRDLAQAGIIDNIMRAKIRDAAFVIVDLTHDNAGAYWEAGYAEGLGKPVIYMCERTKFESKQTHFDTNHCTTVPWSLAEPDRFRSEIIATLRRSLNLF